MDRKILWIASVDNGEKYEDHRVEIVGVFTSKRVASKVSVQAAQNKRSEFLWSRAWGCIESVVLDRLPDGVKI